MALLRTLITFIVLSFTIAPLAMAEDDVKTLNTNDEKVVVSTNGNCVRTKWQAPSDPCAPQKVVVEEPAPAPPPPPPAPEISQDKRTVYFDFNKTALRADAAPKLDELVGLIKGNGQITQITVHGYADTIGRSHYNDVLSKKRAETVRKYLAARLSIPSNADVRGLGESHLAECNGIKKRAKRIDCLAPDRRVEVELTYQK